jgi:hypothetical protein
VLGVRRRPGTVSEVGVALAGDTVRALRIPNRTLQRDPHPDLVGLTVAEAERKITCLTHLVDRGVPWVIAVEVASVGRRTSELRVGGSNGRWMSLGTMRSGPAERLAGRSSPLLGATLRQAREVADAVARGRRFDRPSCPACGQHHPPYNGR